MANFFYKHMLASFICFTACCFGCQGSAALQSGTELDTVDPCTQEYKKTGMPLPTNSGYNSSIVQNPCAWANLQLTGSFIYWKASANYLASGYLNTSFSPTASDPENLIFNGKVLNPDFKYKPGYKLGIGYKFKRDGWDLFAEYTAFHQKVNTFKQVSSGSESIYASWLTFVNMIVLTEGFKSVSSSWNTKLDILDAEVGRNFFCGQYLTFRPSLGLRSLWLDQSYALTYTSLAAALPLRSFNKSNSWGIGPRFNFDGSWHLCWGLKVLGDIGVSLLYVQDHVSAKQRNPQLLQFLPTNDITYKNREFIGTVKPVLDLSLGLGWENTFYRDKCFISLFLGYDFSNYWDQGSIQLGAAPLVAPGIGTQFIVGGTNKSAGNLSIQGLRATVKFDF